MRLPGFLRPEATLSQQEIDHSLRAMVYEGIASGAMFSLGSGGFMAAYALGLGANNLQVGILAALPFITQVVQLPAILAVERFHLRKAIGLPAWLLSNLMRLPIGAVPFLINTSGSGAVALVVGLLALRGLFAPVWLTSWAGRMRDIVPQQVMGGYYVRRLAMITTGHHRGRTGRQLFRDLAGEDSGSQRCLFLRT